MDKEDTDMERAATRKPEFHIDVSKSGVPSISEMLEKFYALKPLQQKAVLAYLRAEQEDMTACAGGQVSE